MTNGTVSVIGAINDGMGGLKESLTAFRKHHNDVGSALLNVSDGRDKDDERPAYKHQEWPKLVYHADGREVLVVDPAELKDIQRSGFRAQPYPRPQVAVGNPAQEKKELLDRNRELEGKMAILMERLEKVEAQAKGA